MSTFQAYLDNIKIKTGKTADDFKKLAAKKGLLKSEIKAGEIVAWLKKDFELGHGHAMAIYAYFKGKHDDSNASGKEIADHFSGKKSGWKPAYDLLMKEVSSFGDDITVNSTASYLSILKGSRKIALVKVGVEQLDIGIRLKGVAPTKRFEAAGSWNTMMTHRAKVTKLSAIDKELFSWLRSAYEQSGK